MDYEDLGVALPSILLPKERTLLAKWCVIACDQYTSDRAYWHNVEQAVGDTPSSLNAILPEVYLNDADIGARIDRVSSAMHTMIDDGVFEALPPGFMLVERTFCSHSRTRTGLLMALDLERYDYAPDSKTLIRATEGTIASRIPPRLRIREKALLEFPHIMVLIDDVSRSVIEPLAAQKQALKKVYDSDLGFRLGHVRGYFVDETAAKRVCAALEKLLHSLPKPHDGDPMLFAMGDGNHSFATAKAHWEKLKPTLDNNERDAHPARYALCEVVNVHDEGILFEAIHRVVFNAGTAALDAAVTGAKGGELLVSRDSMKGDVRVEAVVNGIKTPLYLSGSGQTTAAGLVDRLIERMTLVAPAAEVDYIHGEAQTVALAKEPGTVGFVLPALPKSQLFDQVSRFGPLPRKAFSMGEADEKRCYLEARVIRKV
jgi:hypothetical protein